MEYRYQYLGNTDNPFYYIERRKELGKWKFCYKVDSIQQAKYLVENPTEIEKTLKIYKVGGIVVAVFLVINILLFNIIY